MSSPDFRIRRVLCALASVLVLSLPAAGQPTLQPIVAPIAACDRPPAVEQRLQSGEVVVDCQDIAGIKYVVGRIWIDQSPQKCWRTMVNPFEFRQRICKRMKELSVLSDEPDCSLLSCTISAIFPIPDFQYVVESHYCDCRHVDFHRISGSFKEFRGFWDLKPVAGGTKSEVTYSMYIDPGFPAPDWLVRMAVRCELPSVLTGLRDRIDYLKDHADAGEQMTLKAACSGESTDGGKAGVSVSGQVSADTRMPVVVPVVFKTP